MRPVFRWSLAATIVLLGSAVSVRAFGIVPEGSDVEIFARYGQAIVDGNVPYRDFFLEYPPGALAAIVPPAFGSPSLHAYAIRFAAMMVVALGLTLFACGGVLAACRASRERCLRALGLVALSPLLLGPVALKRYDALPALLTVIALLLVLHRRFVPSALVVGLATAVKLYPLVLIPLVLVAAARSSRRSAFAAAAAFVAGCGLLFLPFLVLSPHGVVSSIRWQFGRQLQFESSLASLALLAHLVTGTGIGLVSQAHSYAVGGARGTLLGYLTSLALIAALLAVWLRAPRLVRSNDGIVLAWAATIAVVVAFARVLSPQYLLWAVAVVPLTRGSPGRAAAGLLAAACILTNIWFPTHYADVVSHLDGGAVLLLFARNTLLVAAAAVLVVAVWRRSEGRPE